MTGRRKIGARLGMVGYLSILRRLQRMPATTADICEAEIGCMNTARFVLRRMHAVGLVHIASWREREVRCKGFTAVWAFGSRADPAYPGPGAPRSSARSNNVKSSMVALAVFIRTLEQPVTKAELIERTGLNEETVRLMLAHSAAIFFARIAAWQPTEGDGVPAAMWQLGMGRSPARPAPIPRIEIHRAENAKRRRVEEALRLQSAVFGMATQAAS